MRELKNRKLTDRLVVWLFFFMNLELFLNITVGFETIAKPFRICQLLLFLFLVRDANFKFRGSVFRLIYPILGILLFGTLSFVFYGISHESSNYLYFNYLVLILIGVSSFAVLANYQISIQLFKKIVYAQFWSLVLNLVIILFMQKGSVRSSGFFDNPNSMGLSAVFFIILLYKLKSLINVNKYFFFASIALCIVLVNLSVSRASFALLILILLFQVIKNLKFFILLALPLVVLFTIFNEVSIDQFSFINAVARQKSKVERKKKEIRITLAAGVYEAMKDSKYMGVGLGQFQIIHNFKRFIEPYDYKLAMERKYKGSGLVSHNSFLQLFAETGVIGALLFIIFYIRYFRQIHRARESILSNQSFWILSTLILYSLSHVVFLSPLFWIGMGLGFNAFFTSRDKVRTSY